VCLCVERGWGGQLLGFLQLTVFALLSMFSDNQNSVTSFTVNEEACFLIIKNTVTSFTKNASLRCPPLVFCCACVGGEIAKTNNVLAYRTVRRT
jgi:hypothetical protein